MGILKRMRWWGGCAAAIICSAAARGDVDVWFEVVSSSGPGAVLVSVDQGAAGKPLTITTDQAPGTYQITVRMMAEVPVDEALYGYSVDLISSTAANVAVTSLTLLGDFDFDMPIDVAAGPGQIINDASQLVFANLQSGTLELLEFVLTVDHPPGDDVELFCGIGAVNWAGLVSPIMIRYGDADPLDGEEADLVANKPSIILKQYVPLAAPTTGACCHADGSCTVETAEGCGNIAGASYKGDGTDCTSANCPAPVTGACCHPDGTCTLETAAGCGNITNAVYNGDGTDCAAANCQAAPATGACCQPDGTCTTETSAACGAITNAVYKGDGLDCATVNCSAAPAIGACCHADGTCTAETATNCGNITNAVYNGDNTDCAAANCQVTQTSQGQTPPAQVYDRDELRKQLAVLFYLPIEGNDPISLVPVKVLGYLGMNVAFGWGAYDLASMPVRFLLYEITFAILDATLP